MPVDPLVTCQACGRTNLDAYIISGSESGTYCADTADCQAVVTEQQQRPAMPTPNPPTPADLARDPQADLAVCEAATSGPWEQYQSRDTGPALRIRPSDKEPSFYSDVVRDAHGIHNAAFIALARQPPP